MENLCHPITSTHNLIDRALTGTGQHRPELHTNTTITPQHEHHPPPHNDFRPSRRRRSLIPPMACAPFAFWFYGRSGAVVGGDMGVGRSCVDAMGADCGLLWQGLG